MIRLNGVFKKIYLRSILKLKPYFKESLLCFWKVITLLFLIFWRNTWLLNSLFVLQFSGGVHYQYLYIPFVIQKRFQRFDGGWGFKDKSVQYITYIMRGKKRKNKLHACNLLVEYHQLCLEAVICRRNDSCYAKYHQYSLSFLWNITCFPSRSFT